LCGSFGVWYVLSDAPQDARRIDDDEVAHTPRPIRWRLQFHSILGTQSLRLRVLPQFIDVFDQEMHHEIAGVILVVKVLQQRAR
jgi:hypothetical protein